MESIPAASWRRSLAFVGANPGLALHPVDAHGAQIPGEAASCFASFWMAEWSRWGAGNVLLVATLQGWRSYGTNEYFAATLATELTRYFPEAARFPLGGITHTQDEFDVGLDLERGFRATGRKAEMELSGILDRRHFSSPDFKLGTNSAALSNVYLPCSSGRLAEFGVEWPGAASVYPGPRGPSSSGYIAVAESWVM
ncbi:hypothetical protein J7E83_02560 [Arthrobacter sp. ISL-48]|uniref:hypothetical protein n=1 Tax=Arthrobacter sp. ISL-48 TaxID=2819110 RepID=UPI001BEC70AE|nr:hypothetical protein [Arthrobacter sp. ISL-48]MBT2531021.1 hypothetical protein [Arthrobacter sp. ISL-48]